MKKLFILILACIFFIPGIALAADLEWDYPADWADIDGWIVYFTDGADSYNKSIDKADVTQDGVAVTYSDIEGKLNLNYDVEYTFHLTAYNDGGESGSSNSVAYTQEGFPVPPDQLPVAPAGSVQSPGGLITN